MQSLEQTHQMLRLLGDPTRLRLLSVLGAEELSVAELTQITGSVQSRVSTHLGKLKDAGLVKARRSGTTSFYALNTDGITEDQASLFEMCLSRTDDPILTQDRELASAIVDGRKSGRTWADSVAGSMERHYSPGRTWEANARAMLGLAALGDVLDIASGDGVLSALIAPRARTVTCLDSSEKVVRAGRQRLAHLDNVRFVRGDMHQLPLEDDSFDHVLLLNALSFATDVSVVLKEAARTSRPNGILVGTALAAHQHYERAAQYNHENHGFEPDALRDALEDAGFMVELCEITSRERRPPHFESITLHARLKNK